MMTDNELLLAISEIVEKKIKAETEPLKISIQQVETGLRAEIQRVETDLRAEILELRTDVTNIKLDIENVVKPQIQLLAENYLPAAKRYEKATEAMEAMQADMDVMKSVIREHSGRIQKLEQAAG